MGTTYECVELTAPGGEPVYAAASEMRGRLRAGLLKIEETPMFRTIDDSISVFGQIEPDDVAAAKAQGFATIINNRPDDEQPGQPSGAEIEAASKAAGLDYVAIPVDHSGFSEWQVKAMADALQGAKGPVLAFCRSGTRSTFLWALARHRLGDDGEKLIAKAAGAGYDLGSIRPVLAG